MYSILDTAAQTFLNPVTFITDAEAIRWFTTVVNSDREENNIARYPNQFILYRIGSFDASLGRYEDCSPKELIIGTSCVTDKTYGVKEITKILDEYFNKTETHKPEIKAIKN